MRIVKLDENSKKNVLENMLKRSPNNYGDFQDKVDAILKDVKEKGDEALFEYTKKFDGFDLNADNIVVTDEEIEEERRICYVGITRAKKRLYLTYCNRRRVFGYDTDMERSRFIDDMDKDLLDSGIKKKSATIFVSKPTALKKEEPKISNANNCIFKTGDKINHKIFGDGIVVSKDDSTITVAFKAEVGVKKLKANHPSLRKL